MDLSVIYSKTGKGLRVLAGKSRALPGQQMRALALVDGRSSIETLLSQTDDFTEAQLGAALDSLEQEGYIKPLRSIDPDLMWQEQDSFSPIEVAELSVEEFHNIKTKPAPEEKAAPEHPEAFGQEGSRLNAAAERKAREGAERLARLEQELASQAAAEARAQAERLAQQEAARLAAETERKAQQEAEQRAHQEAELERKARAEADRAAQAAAEARAQAELQAREADEIRAKQETEARLAAAAERKARQDAEHRARIEAEQAAQAAAEARAQAEAEAREAAERQARQEAEARAQAETIAKQEAEARLAAEALAHQEALASAEAERQERQQAEAKAKTRKEQAEAKRQARIAAELKAHAEAEAREQAERLALEEAEARADAERIAKQEAEARLAAEALAREEAQATAEAERRAREEAEARAAADRLAREAGELERKAREEVETREREEAERRAREEAEARLAAETRALEEAFATAEAERRAREEAEARLAAEEQARVEAEARAEAERQAIAEATARAEADRVAREQAEARAEAERIAAQEAAARAEAERIANAEAEARAQAEAARRAQERAELEAREIAERQARTDAKELEKAQARARDHARRLQRAEEKAKRKEEAAQARAQALEQRRLQKAADAERKRHAREGRAGAASISVPQVRGAVRGVGKLAKFAVLGAVPAVLALLMGLQFVNLAGLIPVDSLVSEKLATPVRVHSLRAVLLPRPQFVLERVRLVDAPEVRFGAIHVVPVLASLLEPAKVMRQVEIDGIEAPADKLAEALRWLERGGSSLRLNQIVVRNAQLQLGEYPLPVFDAVLRLDQTDRFVGATLKDADGKLEAELTPHAQGVSVAVHAENWQLPFGPALVFGEIRGQGVADAAGMRFDTLNGRLYGGSFKGDATLRWQGGWSLTGDSVLSGAGLHPLSQALKARLALTGTLDLDARYTARASAFDKLLAEPSLKGGFVVRDGTIAGVSLARTVMRDARTSGEAVTRYDRLSGNLSLNDGKYQFRQLKLTAKQLSATGEISAGEGGALEGSVNASMSIQGRQFQNRLRLSGTTAAPQLQ